MGLIYVIKIHKGNRKKNMPVRLYQDLNGIIAFDTEAAAYKFKNRKELEGMTGIHVKVAQEE